MTDAAASTDTKRQHYVPQFYLREFSTDVSRATVATYVIPSGVFVGGCPIKRQAYENYFYGRDGGLERALGKLENGAAPIVRSIVQHGNIPTPGSQEHSDLLIFAILLHSRTKEHADKTNEWTDRLIKTVFSRHPDMAPDLDQLKIELTNAPGFAVSHSFEAALLASDLKCKLLVNRTNESLITSDNPSIFYNQFMEIKGLQSGSTGTAFKGFQVFIPLSGKHCLYYFDSDVYGVGQRSELSVDVRDPADIWSLNLLQAIHAHESLYFDASVQQKHCAQLVQAALHYRGLSRVSIERTQMSDRGLTRGSLLTASFADIRCGLSLSFSRILKKAKAYSIGDSLVHVRPSRMVDLYIQYRQLVMRGDQPPGTFHRFAGIHLGPDGQTDSAG